MSVSPFSETSVDEIAVDRIWIARFDDSARGAGRPRAGRSGGCRFSYIASHGADGRTRRTTNHSMVGRVCCDSARFVFRYAGLIGEALTFVDVALCGGVADRLQVSIRIQNRSFIACATRDYLTEAERQSNTETND